MLEAGKRREARFQGQPRSLGDTLNLAIAILGELVPLQPVTLTLHLSQCGVICAKRRERSERANSSEMALVLALGTFLVYDLFSFLPILYLVFAVRTPSLSTRVQLALSRDWPWLDPPPPARPSISSSSSRYSRSCPLASSLSSLPFLPFRRQRMNLVFSYLPSCNFASPFGRFFLFSHHRHHLRQRQLYFRGHLPRNGTAHSPLCGTS